MTKNRTNLVIGALGLVVILLSSCCPFESSQEWKQQNQKVGSLLASKATRSQVEAELGKCVYYEKGATNWEHLEVFLKRDKRADIRERMHGSTRVMYYTTEAMMTWLFLDDHDRMQGYYICPQ
jgi:hypothetical protein